MNTRLSFNTTALRSSRVHEKISFVEVSCVHYQCAIISNASCRYCKLTVPLRSSKTLMWGEGTHLRQRLV